MNLIAGLKWLIPIDQNRSNTGLNVRNASWMLEKMFGGSLLLKENRSYVNENDDNSQDKIENKTDEKNEENKDSKLEDEKGENKSHPEKDAKSKESRVGGDHEKKLNNLEKKYEEHCKHLENNGKRIRALEEKLKEIEERHNDNEKRHKNNQSEEKDDRRNDGKDNTKEKKKPEKMKKIRKTRPKSHNKKAVENNDSEYDGDNENSDTTIYNKYSNSLSTDSNLRSSGYYSKEQSSNIDSFDDDFSDNEHKRSKSRNRSRHNRHKSRHNTSKTLTKKYDPFGFDEVSSSNISEMISSESRFYNKHKKHSKGRNNRKRYSESTSNPSDSTLHTLFPGDPKKFPSADGVYFVTADGDMKKAYGPFHDDKKNPMYYPGIHQLTDKEGRRMIDDQKYRMHPAFMAQLAKGGFYERRVIKPKDEKGAEVVEERFGYFPQRDIRSGSVSEESNYRENPRFMTQNPFRQLFPMRYNNTLGNCMYMEKYLENRLDEIKSKHKQDIMDLEDKTQHLKDFFIKTTDKLENNLNNKTMADIRKNIDKLEDDLREKRGKKYTDDKIGQNNASKLLKALGGPAGAMS